MKRKRLFLFGVSAALLVVVAILGLQADAVAWRATILQQKATGKHESVSWTELLTMLKPGSKFYLRGLAEGPNAYAVIRTPYNNDEDIEAGERLFRSDCMRCHGAEGAGGIATNIVSEPLRAGDSDWAIYRTLTDGITGTAMAPSTLGDDGKWRVTAYLLQLRRTGRGQSRVIENPIPKINVPYDRILRAESEPHNWLTYSRTYTGQRHTTLDGINKNSVEGLTLAWVVQTDARDKIEASPIVVDGVMFVSLPGGGVLALDAETGRQFWRWDSKLDPVISVCCGYVNRGVAVLDDRVYVATLDNKIQSLEAATGRLVWEKTIADSADGYSITVAPLAIKDKIVVGVSGGEFGILGFLDAYDATTGERAWRFHTTPEFDRNGNKSWSGESWRTGGGPTWVTGSYDPELNLLYWGVGNPSPDFDGSKREGDNLYTNSVVALDPDTGELRWYFQFTPHDLHDFDANQVPVLVDRSFSGKQRSLMLWANRNGFYYVLDRTNGEYLGSVPFAKQTWANEIDSSGKPVKAPSSVPTPKGTLVWPGGSGATNWPPPSFSPVTGLMYVARTNRPSIYFSQDVPEERKSGEEWVGSASTFVSGNTELSVVAVDPQIPEVVWEHQLPGNEGRTQFSGILTTPDLVFVGSGETVFALDQVTGERLWFSRLGGQVGSPPVSYAKSNQQYLTIAAGKNIYTFRTKQAVN